MTGPGPKDDPDLTYPGAPDSLIAAWQRRRSPVRHGKDESLPPLDIDLEALRAEVIPTDEPGLPEEPSRYLRKLLRLRRELAGRSELAALNADLIVHLRRRKFPDHTPALFRRIWLEQAPSLIAELPGRWLISSVITFADHGETEVQRRIGQSLNMLFSLVKLYEFERLLSGVAADTPVLARPPKGSSLPLGMRPFSLLNGGLDINLLAPIWAEAQREPVVGPLACHLLDQLNADPRTLFRRIQLMRTTLRDAKDPDLDAELDPVDADADADGSDADPDQSGDDRQP